MLPPSSTDVHEPNEGVSRKPDPKRHENPPHTTSAMQSAPFRTNKNSNGTNNPPRPSCCRLEPKWARFSQTWTQMHWIPPPPSQCRRANRGHFMQNCDKPNSTNDPPFTVLLNLQPKRRRFAQIRPQVAQITHLDLHTPSTTKTGRLRAKRIPNGTNNIPQPSR